MNLYIWAVIAGGALGAVVRYLLVQYMPRARSGFSWGIFTANVAGSGVLAILTAASMVATTNGGDLPAAAIGLVGVGFCGALTTFSTFSTDTVGLLRAGHLKGAATYVGLSIMSALVLVTAIFLLMLNI
ncbi:MAG: CrcB family protein [Lawsonella sp.]|nr:CrcB family protein [Mycobacteriales bacterium]